VRHRRPAAVRAVVRAVALSTLVVVGFAVTVDTAGATSELPPTATRRAVERLVHTTYPDLAFGNIACPEPIARRAGTTFSCTVQLAGAFLVVDGKIGSSSGAVTFAAAQAVLPTTALEQFVGANTSLPATVDCGAAPVQVARPGDVIPCSVALADGTTRTAQLTVSDTAGAVVISGIA
jgi:hypothetical protein